MGATTKYAFPYPESNEPPDGPTQIKALAQAVETTVVDVQSATVMRFATAAARDAALVGALAPRPGMVSYTADDRLTREYNTIGAWSGWTPLPGTPMAAFYNTGNQPITANTATSAAFGPAFFSRDITASAGTNGVGTKFTPLVAGRYQMCAVVAWGNATGGARQAWFSVSGSPVTGTMLQWPAAVPNDLVAFAMPVTYADCNGSTQYLELRVLSSVATDLRTSSQLTTSMTITYAGPF